MSNFFIEHREILLKKTRLEKRISKIPNGCRNYLADMNNKMKQEYSSYLSFFRDLEQIKIFRNEWGFLRFFIWSFAIITPFVVLTAIIYLILS